MTREWLGSTLGIQVEFGIWQYLRQVSSSKSSMQHDEWLTFVALAWEAGVTTLKDHVHIFLALRACWLADSGDIFGFQVGTFKCSLVSCTFVLRCKWWRVQAQQVHTCIIASGNDNYMVSSDAFLHACRHPNMRQTPRPLFNEIARTSFVQGQEGSRILVDTYVLGSW